MASRITIVIPTRERCDTLLSALTTCVSQDYDDLEILVSDNASGDQTPDVVESFNDPRVRYVNTGKRVSMMDNWEFAISHVSQGHLGIIGDDDGLLPGGIVELADLLHSEPTDAVIWPVYNYYWPGYVDGALANCLTMRTWQPGRVDILVSKDVLEGVAHFQRHPHDLPSVYWGVVAAGAVQRAQSRSGRFLNSITPDIYAGVAIAATTDHYLRTDRAVTLSGESRHSNAGSQITGLGRNDQSSPSETFMRENRDAFHPDLSYAANIPVLVAEAMAQARDHLGATVPSIQLEEMFQAALGHPDHLFNASVWASTESALADTARARGLSSEYQTLVERSHRSRKRRLAKAIASNVVAGAPLFTCPPDVKDIHGAVQFAADLRTSNGRLRPAARDTLGRAHKVVRGFRSRKLEGQW